ncbi:LysM peptidoglycan-binding domain-containing protein [Proteus mirabilis]|uniref:LysM peptidoglycan-binding domain-containing protein n=1 Tax=Proteus mirabilis TaxID=584 RepID=UPI0034D54719
MTTLNNVPSPRPSSITRKVAWLNIFIQLALPIVTTMPTHTFANENNFKKHNIININQQNTYQVKAGDTPESIAKNFNIKLFKLIEANPQHVSLTGELKINDGTILNIPNEYLLKKSGSIIKMRPSPQQRAKSSLKLLLIIHFYSIKISM